MRVTPGSTRAIQGVCEGVFSAKTFCMSMQIWAVRSVRGPKGSASNRFVGIRAVARMPVLAIRPPRTPASRRPLDPAAASHDLQQSRRGFDQLQPNPGWVAERFKAPVLKTGVPARVPWVRIPPHPLPPIRTEGGALRWTPKMRQLAKVEDRKSV